MEVDRSCESGLWNVVGGFIARPLNRPLNPPLNIDSDLDQYETRGKNLTLQSIDITLQSIENVPHSRI